jgi:hypothetical protein
VKAKGGGNTGTTQGDLVTKILYGNMGDDNFAVWSTAVGNWTEIADRGVAVGGLFGKSHPLVGPPPSDVLSGVAKAEFYYEPRTDSGSKEAQVEVQDVGGPSIPGLGAALIASDKNCMWNLRWRARLRRYRHPAPAFAFALGSGIEGLLTSTITDVSGGLGGAGGGAGGTAITDVVNPLANAYSGIANLPWPADPGTTTNPDAPAPGIYH